MKNLLTYDEALELTWLVRNRFESVWKLYVDAVNHHQIFGDEFIEDCRKDVLQYVGLLRKLRSIRLALL